MSDAFITALGPVNPSWQRKTIADLAVYVGSGVTPTGGSDVYTTSGVTFIRSQNVTNEGLLLDDVAFIDEHTHERMSGSAVAPFDVLLNITGASIGRCCFLPSGLGPTNVNQHVCAIRLPAADEGDAKFLSSVLSSPIGQNQIFRLNAGGNREGLNYQQLRRFQIPWPPQAQRSKIARILTALDNVIAQTEALIAKYQAIKQGLMHDLFTRGVDATGKLRPPQSEAPELYKQSDLGWIPKEWEVVPLCQVAEVGRGKFTPRPRNDPKYYGGEYPFIQTGNIAASIGRYLSDHTQTLNDLGTTVSKRFPEGTIVVTIAANIADTAILAIPMYLPDSIVGVIVHENMVVRFFELCLRRAKHILDAKAPQSAQKNINLTDLWKLLVPQPTVAEQRRISMIYESSDRLIAAEERTLEKLRTKKTGLMQDLLTGKVPVKADESVETTA